MKRREYRDYYRMKRKEHKPGLSVGIFFILLGVALLIATNDLFHLGNIGAYFSWETAMIFIGVLLLINLRFVGGVLLIAGGIWFLQDRLFIFTPDAFKIFYWPAVIGLIGLTFIVSSLFKPKK